MTSASLADTLTHRFGAGIARAVLSAVSLDGADDAIGDLEIVQRVIGMAAGARTLGQECPHVRFWVSARSASEQSAV